MSELFRALAELTLPPSARTERLAALLDLPAAPTLAEHTELFEILLYPRAAVYLGPEGMFGGEAEDRIAGFLRALGAVIPAEPDHLGVLLHAYAELAEAAPSSDRAAHARRALLWEHLASWVPVYLAAVSEHAPAVYRGWAELLAQALDGELASAGAVERLPLHLRESPALPDPREDGGEAFVAALLAPARTGFIITRADLGRACDELGLGRRQGERRYVLRAMLGQDSARSLEWLARTARECETRHAALTEDLGPIRDFWTGRTASAAALLGELAADQAALATA